MTHTLTVDAQLFKKINTKEKTLMILKDDKNYVVNDTIIFQLEGEREELITTIEYLEIEVPGLKNGYVAFTIKPKEYE